MAQQHSTATDRSLARLPEHQRETARARAWALFQGSTMTLAEATAFTVSTMLSEPAPKPLGERLAAARRVVTVESASTPGRVYEVVDGVCSCTAAKFGRPCWHVRAARQQQLAAA